MRAPLHSRKWFLSSLLVVQVLALTLFVVGPQAGSLDDDGDGSPDVPIVVATTDVTVGEFPPRLCDGFASAAIDVNAVIPTGLRSDGRLRCFSASPGPEAASLLSFCHLRC